METSEASDIGEQSMLNAIKCFHLGNMNVECKYCKSINFAAEQPNDELFNSCCRKGKVKLPERSKPYPPFMKEILSDLNHPNHDNFIEFIRNYNSELAFTSFGATVATYVPGRGPSCFRAQAQIYHFTPHLQAANNGSPKYAQFYVLDHDAASNPQNSGCLSEIFQKLEEDLRSINPYVGTHKMMKYFIQEEELNNTTMPRIHMVIQYDYNIAIVFSNIDGEPPFHRDIRAYPLSDVNNSDEHIQISSPDLDPMVYPIFYPCGYPGWQPGKQVESYRPDERQSTKVTMLQFKSAQLAIRPGQFNPLHYGGKLFQVKFFLF